MYLCASCGWSGEYDQIITPDIETLQKLNKEILSIIQKNNMRTNCCPKCYQTAIFFNKEDEVNTIPSMSFAPIENENEVHEQTIDSQLTSIVNSLKESEPDLGVIQKKPERMRPKHDCMCDTCDKSFQSKVQGMTRCTECIKTTQERM